MKDAPAIVHVIDDDGSWRVSVGRLLQAAGYRVELYDSAESFFAAGLADSPGCILLDVNMPGLSGLECQQQLALAQQAWPIVFVSAQADISITVRAVKAGAQDFLTKPVPANLLLDAVAQAIASGQEGRQHGARLATLRGRIRELTPSERRIFDLVVRGRLNKQIAADLGVSERTVKWHRHNLASKLQVQSLAGLVSLAEQLGMIADEERTGAKR
jgi:FixJ family two-component response regulator